MSRHQKNRMSFRPAVEGAILEERVVLNGAQSAAVASISASQNNPGLANRRMLAQVESMYRQQIATTNQELRNYIRTQVQQLYANGRPTPQQLANLNANIRGAVNASALRMLSQYNLLPGTSSMGNQLQSILLGNQPGSLSSRVSSITARTTGLGASSYLTNALNQQVSTAFQYFSGQLGNYFRNAPVNRLSVDQTGNQIPLNQYMGNQLVNQFNGNYANLANNFNAAANAALFADVTPGTTGVVASQAAQNAFQQQIGNALGTFAYQIGSAAQVIPGANTGLLPQLNKAFYGLPTTGANVGGLYNQITGALNTPNDLFAPGAAQLFQTNFAAMNSPFSTFLGTTPQTSLPLGTTYTSPFNTNFASNNFNNGFNNGFGAGVIGLNNNTMVPNGFNNNFGTGFNNYVSTLNQQYAFTQPTSGSLGPGAF